MAFINNQKFAEIRNAAKDGNEKAKMILQAMRKNAGQGDVDRLVNDYYAIPDNTSSNADFLPQETNNIDIEQAVGDKIETSDTEKNQDKNDIVDISLNIEEDMKDLIDTNEIDDVSFMNFLKEKKKNGLRARKNADHFKIYDGEGRKAFMDKSIGDYKNKFNPLLKDIEHRHQDTEKALGGYVNSVNDILDDDIDLDENRINDAYSAFTDSDEVMHSFGRYWDEEDNKQVVDGLKILIKKFGKKNVLAALNTLKNDNDNYKNYMNNKIDTEIGRYSKSIEDLLK